MKLLRTPSGYLPCRAVLDFLDAYLDGELEVEERHEFDRHLAVCPSCVAYLATYRTTIALSRAVASEGPAEGEGESERDVAPPASRAGDREPAPEPLPADLVAAILAARSR